MAEEKSDRTVVIAGVGPGLGAFLARTFAQHGCRIGLFARSRDYLRDLEEEIKKRNGSALGVTVDLTDADQIAKAFAQVRKAFRSVDVLIYYAGSSAWAKSRSWPAQGWAGENRGVPPVGIVGPRIVAEGHSCRPCGH